ncbi:MAG: hypothetical protein K2R98_12550 [Gemmataceae bacterium]|nr:hypothetical protein [Gemmataceae bacterium]
MRRLTLALVAVFCLQDLARAADAPTADFQPDPKSVRRHGPAYRYPQAGWIVLHIEGEPYERGYQHGRLLASEIAGYVRCFAALQNTKAPAEGWKTTRTLTNALFLRRFDKEYLEEMKGIADGAAACGAKFDGRAIDLIDIVVINCWAEIESLDSALEATPNGLEGIKFPKDQPKAMPPPRPMHCSAFAATGPATAAGKIVFGHVTMFDLYPSNFYNVWLDVKPSKGHRVLMQTYPGGIQSGMDYYLNSAGLLVSETTIHQTRFDIKGMALASRIRQAVQYADSIDKAVEILKKENNGLYTNEWLLADTKTNEIAMFELGTAKSKLWRSGKNEWFGDTPGFYWGCNNAKDLDVRLDTVPSLDGRPANVVWKPSDRDKKWLELYGKHKGKIDVGFGKEAFATPPLCSHSTLDAKFTTTALAKDLKSWALFGPPMGRTWLPNDEEKQKFSEIKPLVSNPWTILHAGAPAKDDKVPAVVDLPEKVEGGESDSEKESRKGPSLSDDEVPATKPAWHGTILPRTDGDVWLATAFAEYEKIVALENALREASDGKLMAADKDRIGLELFAYRSRYLAAARATTDTPLSKIRSDVRQDQWYQIASGKGVLVLHELRRRVGESKFVTTMESFGREHAGKPVTTAIFRAHFEKESGTKLDDFFYYWLDHPGLPNLYLLEAIADEPEKRKIEAWFNVLNKAFEKEKNPEISVVDVTTESGKGEKTKALEFGRGFAETGFNRFERAGRLIVDKHGWTAKANGGAYSILSFYAEQQQTLIVYGTLDEIAANQETAELLRKGIRDKWSNRTVTVLSDKQVMEEDLRTHHVLLIGRPDSNAVVQKFQNSLPIAFGPRSFTARWEGYAHPNSAVIAAADNPLNKRYSMVVLAGLSAEATYRTPDALLHVKLAPEVLVLPNGGKSKSLVIPAKELVHEFGEK